MNTTPLGENILAWYRENARSLPWRGIRNPYGIWVSEIMLQQTRVETVIPYYRRWMQTFSSIAVLAGSEQQSVLSLWEGLGYYRRALNLHRAARVVVQEHHGKLPETAKALQTLPGIGRYTAAAIASIAFGENIAALDGNIKRILARVFSLRESIGESQTVRQLWLLAEENLPPGHAGEYNQGLMDLGALICTPHNPGCSSCPLAAICRAFAARIQNTLPVRTPRRKIPHYTVTAGILHKGEHVLVAQRPEHGLLAGLWEFPGGKQNPGETLPACLQRELDEELGIKVAVEQAYGKYKHAYTHFRITLHAFHCRIIDGEPAAKVHRKLHWSPIDQLAAYPMGKIDREIAKNLMEDFRKQSVP